MKVYFTANGWNDYQYWLENDLVLLVRINARINDARRHPLRRLGKLEALKRELSGGRSRRITIEHRLVYRKAGEADVDQPIEVAMCRNHYI